MNKFMSKDSEIKKGFTIIEVVLVLAVAGLIFLMVFIALPALQRSQRDSQRKRDMFRLATALKNYKANNKQKNLWDGATKEDPSVDFTSVYVQDIESFVDNYLKAGNDTFKDPLYGEYRLRVYGLLPGVVISADYSWYEKRPEWRAMVKVNGNSRCENQAGQYSYSSGGGFTIIHRLENGGWVCQEF